MPFYLSILITNIATSESVFCPLLRASCFEALTRFRVPQNTTCRVPVNTKIRPAGRIKCNRKKRLEAVLLRVHFIKMLCINPLVKFILQSNQLLIKVLQCDTRTNSAFGSQTLPHINNEPIRSLYLPYSFSAGNKKCIRGKK